MSALKTDLPKATVDGLTLWPIPEFNHAEVVFGADESCYFNRRRLPDVPSEYTQAAQTLFFSGGTLPRFANVVDAKKAAIAIRALLSSFAPSHESKMATVGYAMWLWSTPEALTEGEKA